jgi:hypothetical protein
VYLVVLFFFFFFFFFFHYLILLLPQPHSSFSPTSLFPIFFFFFFFDERAYHTYQSACLPTYLAGEHCKKSCLYQIVMGNTHTKSNFNTLFYSGICIYSNSCT